MVSERVTAIHMSAFRGIRDTFDLDFEGGKSLLVLGPNATGKSSLADAVEWHLSGEIELLQHEGRHQDVRHMGADETVPTFVHVYTTGDLGGETWQDPNLGAEPHRRAVGETYLLQRRTLSGFVNLTKGDKWKRFASLLGLEEVDQLRLDMQTVSNKLEQAAIVASGQLVRHQNSLEPLWESRSENGLWTAIRDACDRGGVGEPESLDEALDPSWSSAIAAKDPESDRATKVERVSIAMAETPEFDVDTNDWNSAALVLHDPTRAEFSLLKAADILLSTQEQTGTCPLCGQPIDQVALVKNTSERLAVLFEDSKDWDEAEAVSASTIGHIVEVLKHRQRVVDLAERADLTFPDLPIADVEHLLAFAREGRELDEMTVAHTQDSISAWDQAVSSIVKADPAADVDRLSPTVRLVLLLERGRAWRDAAMGTARAQLAAERASSIFSTISQKQSELIEQILHAISAPLAEIYSVLHPDEALDAAAVEQWGEKGLELSIEYHGERRKPPHGVLSESHLNSLAIAVFLAMAETFNEQIGFLVLDDVVSSFDIEHRRVLAEMLVERYEEWQLIILTHDRLFFERIRKLAPDWRAIEFTSWDFEEGPRLSSYITTDQITRARSAIEADDVTTAATAVRRALEEMLQEICEGVAGLVPFRRGFRNDRREAQELINGLRRTAKQLDAATKATLQKKLLVLETDLQAALNPEAHASQEWSSLSEIGDALDQVEELNDWWTCGECSTRLWHTWTGTSGSCKCGLSRIPPVTKSGA